MTYDYKQKRLLKGSYFTTRLKFICHDKPFQNPSVCDITNGGVHMINRSVVMSQTERLNDGKIGVLYVGRIKGLTYLGSALLLINNNKAGIRNATSNPTNKMAAHHGIPRIPSPERKRDIFLYTSEPSSCSECLRLCESVSHFKVGGQLCCNASREARAT